MWTPENAKNEFGEKGKNGVVEITSKEPVTIDSTADGSVKVQYIGADGTLEGSEVPQPLYVIDGQVMPDDYNLNSINQEDIESINVLKDGKQTEIYGERAKDGVICITLKKKAEGGVLRFIPISEPIGNLEEFDSYKLYNATEYFKTINYEEYLKIPSESLAYLFVENTTTGKKTLHAYMLDYDMEVHLSKCRSTTDVNDDNLSWINENTRIIIDGKHENYEGYLRTLKFQSDNIAMIEYHKYSRSNMKLKKRICNGYVNVIYKDAYTGPKVTIYTTMRRDWHYAYLLTD